MQKDIAQMRRELHEFYFYEVKPALQALNAKRKKKRVEAYLVATILIGFCLVFFFPMVGVPLIFGGGLLMVFFDDRKKTKSSVDVVDFSGEMEIKEKFMSKFLNIFGENFKWQKWGFSQDELAKLYNPQDTQPINAQEGQSVQDYQKYNKMNLLPFFPIFSIDDSIAGIYRDVKFSINEYDSTIFKLNNLPLLVLVIGLGMPLLGVVFFVMFFLFSFIIKIFAPYPLISFILTLIDFFGPLILLIIGVRYLITKTQFKGVVVEFDMNKNFEGHTFVLENAKTSNCIKFDHSKFEEIKLEDVEFNKKYNVYSNDQVEARYVLTTGFMERFLNMKTAFNAKYIRAAFKDGKISIAMHVGKDLFAMGSLNKDTDSNTFTELFDEILSVLELIKELKLNQKIGL